VLRRARWLPALLPLVLVAVLAADGVVLYRFDARPRGPISVAVERGAVEEMQEDKEHREEERETAIKRMFDRRADGIVTRDRTAFLADIDRTNAGFVRRQEALFDSLGKLEFDHWSYLRQEGSAYSLSSIDVEPYEDAQDLWLPVLVLRYQLHDFDEEPVARRIVYTVAKRQGRWKIANDTDLEGSTSSGTTVKQDPWENGPIVVAKSSHSLVIGHPSDASEVKEILRESDSAVAHVSAFTGKGWGERVVVVLPASPEELVAVLDNPYVPYAFTAIAHPQFTSIDPAVAELAGVRVVINPESFSAKDALNSLLLRHETTHVATMDLDGPLMPKWLVEGYAEYVGNHGSQFPTLALGSGLAEVVAKTGVPTYLPLDSDFGYLADAGVGYSSAWMLCRYLGDTYGRSKLYDFYRVMGNREGLDRPGEKLDSSLGRIFGLDEKRLLAAWRPYVRAAVGDLVEEMVEPGGAYKQDDSTDSISAKGLAGSRGYKQSRLEAADYDRAAQSLWAVGDPDRPDKWVASTIVVSRTEKGGRQLEQIVHESMRPYDPSSRSIPHGRLYEIGTTVHGRTYRTAVAVLRVGIAVIEIRVATSSGDPRNEARRLAERQYQSFAA
jgi:hypothetical protein